MNEPPLPEPSALATLAERCQVTLHVARHALRRLADAPAGELRVLRRTDGAHVVYDPRRPMAQGMVAGPFGGEKALERADAAMRALARKERGR